MTTIEEEMVDHCWSCEMCRGTVYSMGFLGTKGWGRCCACGWDQHRETEETDGLNQSDEPV